MSLMLLLNLNGGEIHDRADFAYQSCIKLYLSILRINDINHIHFQDIKNLLCIVRVDGHISSVLQCGWLLGGWLCVGNLLVFDATVPTAQLLSRRLVFNFCN